MSEAATAEAAGLRVAVDARALDIDGFRTQGIGRYAHSLLGPLHDAARGRGGELVLLRQPASGSPASPYGGDPAPAAPVLRVRRPPVPPRLVDWPEQLLLPLDLRRSKARVAHALSIYRAAVWPGVPTVMTMLDVVPLMWPDQYLKSGLGHRMLYRAARRARLLLAISDTVRRDVIAHLGVSPKRVVCVPLAAHSRFAPADPRPARKRLSLEGPYLLYVGGLQSADPRKNLEGLVDAYARWRREQHRDEVLVLVGQTGAASRALEARAAAARAPVRFAGFVPDEELPGLLSGARCLVTASRYEGFGLPALEAISCGTPVVAFDAGAVPEVAGPGGLLAPDGDGDALMRAVARVCDEPAVRERLSAAGRRHARRYSWRRTAELTWDAYERVAAQREARSPIPREEHRAHAGGSSP